MGVAENWRTSEGVGFVFSMETDNGIRTDGMSDLRSIVTALVVLIAVVAIGAGVRYDFYPLDIFDELVLSIDF